MPILGEAVGDKVAIYKPEKYDIEAQVCQCKHALGKSVPEVCISINSLLAT